MMGKGLNFTRSLFLAGILAGGMVSAAWGEEAPAAAGSTSEQILKPVSELVEVFNKLNLPLNAQEASKAVAEALARTADPASRIMTDEEIARMQARQRGVVYEAPLSFISTNGLPVVTEVVPDSPAAQAGLQVGDRVEEIDGEVPVQLGGGMRDLDTIDRYVELGIEYVIIGTAAVKHPGFLQDACVAFPGHVMVGLDAKDGKVAIDGWARSSGHDVVELARKFEDYGVEAVVYTDIGRDGMLSGVNVEATARLARALRATPVIASGGIATLADIEALCAIEEDGVMGAITGRAIYEGTLDFKAAQALADELAARRSAQRTA